MFFHGVCEEQVLLARLRNRGLVVITGCGHPTVQVILAMVRQLSNEPVFATCRRASFPVDGEPLETARTSGADVHGYRKTPLAKDP